MGCSKVQHLNGRDYVSFHDILVNVLHIVFGDELIDSRQSISVVCCQTFKMANYQSDIINRDTCDTYLNHQPPL